MCGGGDYGVWGEGLVVPSSGSDLGCLKQSVGVRAGLGDTPYVSISGFTPEPQIAPQSLPGVSSGDPQPTGTFHKW